MPNLKFGNVNSSDYGVFLTNAGIMVGSKRVYDEFDVAGKNGNLIIDTGRYEMKQLSYPAIIYSDYENNMLNYRSAMESQVGKFRISDDFMPAYFRIGYLSENMSPKNEMYLKGGTFTIDFMANPQLYLVSGETETTFTAQGTINNPTNFESKPLLKVTGTGSLSVNGTTINVIENTGELYIDCESMECYEGLVFKNSNIVVTDFPVLRAGSNTILPATNMIIKIIPRWWEI